VKPTFKVLIAQDDGTDIEFRNIGFYTSDAEFPKEHRLTFKVPLGISGF